MSKYFLYALVAILAGIGGTALIDGWSIVQVERGWTQVIAGATALSAAAIVLAIALLLRAVEALGVGMARSQALPVKGVPVQAIPKIADKRAEKTPEKLAEDEPALAQAKTGLPRPTLTPRQTADVVRPTLRPTLAPHMQMSAGSSVTLPANADLAAPHPAVPFVAPPSMAIPRQTFGDAMRDDFAAAPAPKSPDVNPFAAPPAEPVETDIHATFSPITPGRDERKPLLPPVTSSEVDREKTPPASDAADEEPELDWLKRRRAHAGNGIVGGEAARRAALAASLSREPPSKSRKLLRRYDAGGATYMLFDDGSIDQETSEGLLNFPSMKELRDHLTAKGVDLDAP